MSTIKRYATFLSLLLPLAFAVPSALQAQAAPAPAGQEVTEARMRAYVGAFLDRIKVQEEYDQKLALVGNKSDEAQEVLREERKAGVLAVFRAHSITEQEFNWITFVVSSNQNSREAFEAMLEEARNQTP